MGLLTRSDHARDVAVFDVRAALLFLDCLSEAPLRHEERGQMVQIARYGPFWSLRVRQALRRRARWVNAPGAKRAWIELLHERDEMGCPRVEPGGELVELSELVIIERNVSAQVPERAALSTQTPPSSPLPGVHITGGVPEML